MKAFQVSLTGIAFLVCICRLSGQLFFTNSSGMVLTNGIGQERAVSLASHLARGMKEEDAMKFLARNGLQWSEVSAGDNYWWSTFIPLTNKCYLVLKNEASGPATNGDRSNGVITGALIQSNGANIVSIPLTNAIAKTK